MRRIQLFLVQLIVVLSFCIMHISAINCLAENYPGKWYGWWHPSIGPSPLAAGAMPQFVNQKVIKAWGYKTGNSFDEIKDLLPGHAFYEVCLKHPEAWGDFRINETKYVPYGGKPWLEATEKYKGTAYVDEKGHIRNYKAGLPFPGTENPIEMAWNVVKNRVEGDCFGNVAGPWVIPVIDRKGHTRWTAGKNFYFFFDGRLTIDPKPLYKPNPHNLMVMQTFGYVAPYDLRGIVPLTYRYDDPDRQDDMWMYLPALRRVRRMSVSQRWDRVPGGADLWWDSFEMFWGKPSNYEWKYLGRKKIFGSPNAKPEAQMMKGKLLGGCDQYWNRINSCVLQGIPKITSPVAKFDLYLDPVTYYPLWAIYYDKKGREWCIYFSCRSIDTRWKTYPVNMIMFDVQRQHSSDTYLVGAGGDVDWLNPGFLTMDNLRKYFGGR